MNQTMVREAIATLQNLAHPVTRHLYKGIPEFGSLPLHIQVGQFHAVHVRRQSSNFTFVADNVPELQLLLLRQAYR